MRRVWLLAALVGCGGPNPETLISELRVVAAVAEPPAVAVGESYQLTATIADPLEEGGDWMIWSCVEDVCEVARGALGVDPPFATQRGLAPVPVWVMACAPGACDVAGATTAQLRDPEAWMRELPLSGVTLASRLTRLTEVPVEERGGNPVITRSPETDGLLPEVVSPAEEVSLGFDVPGAEAAFGMATGGGFTMVRYDVGEAGNTELVWVAPDEAGVVTLYAVFDDELGGTAVWEAVVEVQ